MDLESYGALCREIGCTVLDPWNAHLSEPETTDSLHAGRNPGTARLAVPGPEHVEVLKGKCAAIGLPLGCVAVDGAAMHAPDAQARELQHERARGWIAVAAALGARSVRIDAGGPEEMPPDALALIAAAYKEMIRYASERGVQVVIENHWGPSKFPDNVLRILDACPGLGYLFDTNNWAPGRQLEGWEKCACRATHTHIKTYAWNESGETEGLDLEPAFAALGRSGFSGAWGIESVPPNGDEVGGVRRTAELIRRKHLEHFPQ